MLRIQNLCKRFGKLEVLRNVHLDLEDNHLFFIVGPNGSGKTTLIKCILGMVLPDSGMIYFQEKSIKKQWHYRRFISYMPQIAYFPANITPWELMQFLTKIRGEAPYKEALITYFGIEDFLHKQMRALSGGMRQKVNLVLALMFDTPLYILDEPTTGLDPVANQKLKQLLKRYREQQKTFIITSHVMRFVEEVADIIVFLLEGHIHFKGSVQQLLQETQTKTLEEAIAKHLSQ